MSIFKEQGMEPFTLLLKILLDVTAHFGHTSETVKNSIWLSNDSEICNERAVHTIYSMILFKSARGGIVSTVSYGEAIENPEDRSEILSHYDIDLCYGTYYSGTQRSKVKPYQQYPGVEGFPMAAGRISIGFMDLREGSHVKLGNMRRTINDSSNTVLLWVGDRYLNAIPITPYLYIT